MTPSRSPSSDRYDVSGLAESRKTTVPFGLETAVGEDGRPHDGFHSIERTQCDARDWRRHGSASGCLVG